MTFFREESMRRLESRSIGTTLIKTPPIFSLFTRAGMLLVLALVGYLYFGTYTASEKSTGVVLPLNGVVKIYDSNDGVVDDIHVGEGESVEKGRALASVRDQDSQSEEMENYSEVPTEASDPPANADNDRGGAEDESGRDSATEMAPEPGDPSRSNSTSGRVLRAPIDGTVYQIRKMAGDAYYQPQEIMEIAKYGPLVVRFPLSSKSRNTVKKGDKVTIKLAGPGYDAMDVLTATVVSVSRAPTVRGNPFTGVSNTSYQTTAILDEKTSSAHRDRLLGASVEARVPLESRRLYQWLLDPLKKLFH